MEANKLADFLAEKPQGFLIAGLGASAGGIQALKEFFEHVPEDSHVAYVVILHLSPDHDSKLAEVLQAVTAIPVSQVREKTKIEPDHIYVVPPNQHLIMEDGHIAPSVNLYMEERRAPVDIFFRTLADSHGPRAVCAILSGTGADGSMGLKRVKENGGVVYVQNPREAEFNEMPRNAIATDLVDEVLAVSEIPDRIFAYRNSLSTVVIAVEAEQRPEQQQQALREIFTQLRIRTGHDFSNYKRPTLLRRIERRINVRQLPDLPSYAAFIHQNLEETNALLKDLLISVTNFFRDKKPFAAIEQDVLPTIFKNKTANDEVRIWVAGCATGEEAYSIAMLVAERTMGAIDAPKFQIFATDIDEAAITAAREGLYTLNDAADVSPERLRQFFNKEGDSYRVKRELREKILFANHNFLKDPPFSRLDLVTCRNVLIYLNTTAQERVMETFHFALKPGGFLFLGSAESVDGASDLYATVSRENHIFQAREVAVRNYPVPDSVPNLNPRPQPAVKLTDTESHPPNRLSFGELHQKLLEQYAPPSMIVNEAYEIVHMSEKVGYFLEFSGGELTKDLLKLIRPELRLELRSALYQAVQHKTPIEARNIPFGKNGERTSLNIHVRPVTKEANTTKGFMLVIFEQNQEELKDESILITTDEPIARQLEEELIAVKAQLKRAVEQHEYQAEELKASNEELQAMNEELRSAAEELETSKEELQSMNEELRTVNQELKVKIEETTVTSNNLQNLINSADVATVFLDRSFCTRLYTPAALQIFNLIPADYGRPISDITHRLEYDNLLQDAETILEKLTVIEREVTTTDHRTFMMRGLPYRTTEDRISGVVITFFDITPRKQAEKALQQSEAHLRLLIESARDYAIITLNTERHIVSWSSGAEKIFNYTEAEITGKPSDIIFVPEDRDNKAPEWEVQTADQEGRAENERWHVRKDGTRFWGSGLMQPLRDERGTTIGFVKILRDLTEQRQMQEALRLAEDKYRTQLEHDVEVRTAELQESKELLQATMDSTLDMIQVFEAVRNESGEIVDFHWILNNHATVEKQGDVIGKSLLTINPGVVEEGIFDTFKQVVETGTPDIAERYYVHEQFDGWFYQSAVKLGDGLVSSTTDITARKKAELEISTSRAFLQSVIDSSLDMIQVFDAVRNEAGVIVDFTWRINNQKAIEQNGEVIGRSLLQQNPGVVSSGIFDRMVQVVESGKPYEQEQYYSYEQFPDNWFYLTLVQHEDGVILTTKDITSYKKAEAERLKSLVLLQQSEEVAKTGTWEYNITTGSLSWSEGMYRLFGLPVGSPVSPETYLEYVVEEDKSLAQQVVRQLRESYEPMEETLRLRVDGQVLTFRIKSVVLRNQQGEPIKILGIDLDISEVKRLEEENLQMRLNQQKALLLGILSAQEEERRRISESLHNGIGQLLYATKLNLDQVATLVPPEIIKNTKQLLDDAIQETRRVSHELVPIVLHDFGLPKAIEDLCRRYSESSIQVNCEVEGLEARLESHLEVALYRISQELLNNVIKHAGATQADMLLVQEDGEIILKVRDNGKGINGQQNSKKGIGHRTISDRVKLLNGTFSITKPRTGKGTQITVKIPVTGID